MKTHNIIVVVCFLFLLGLVILVHVPCTPNTSWALFPWALFTNSLPGVPCFPREQHPDDQSWGLNTNETPRPGPHSPLLSVYLICQAECSGLRLQTRPSSSLASSESRHCLLLFAFKSSAWWENRPFHILLVGMNVAQSLEDSLQVSLNYNCPNPWTLSTYAYGKGQILYCLTARD